MIRSTLIFFFFVCTWVSNAQEVYELRTYELGFFRPADVLHDYFKKALIPALNRQGIENVGVFEETSESLPRKIYLLIPYESANAFVNVSDQLESDEQYLSDGQFYLEADPGEVPYEEYISNLIKATSGFPELTKPAEGSQYYELRIYQSYNEDALRRKVKMFNDSEFQIFEDVGLPMVFFGSNIAGDQMPCLTYLLAFKDEAAHGATWQKFGGHPEWQRIRGLEEYANAMNEIIRIFLRPLDYSQL